MVSGFFLHAHHSFHWHPFTVTHKPSLKCPRLGYTYKAAGASCKGVELMPASSNFCKGSTQENSTFKDPMKNNIRNFHSHSAHIPKLRSHSAHIPCFKKLCDTEYARNLCGFKNPCTFRTYSVF